MNMRVLAGLMLLWGIIGGGGCSSRDNPDHYLIRVNERAVTLSAFNQAVEAAGEEAFPGEKRVAPEALKDLRLRVLNQMTEELMISVFAAQNGIAVSHEELVRAVEGIKADYPDDTFEQTLLENAVSYAYWEKRLATRLLVEKVINNELTRHVTITSDDVLAYYQENYPDGTPEDVDADTLNRKVVTHLRRLKAEQAYKDWIEQLRTQYPVEVNSKVWHRLVESAPPSP